MKLCIAEKPSVAKELAQILGASQRRDGYYEGNGYLVSWTFGHLCTLKLPEDYLPELKQWRLSTLPIIPQKFQVKLIGNEGVSRQFRTIVHLLERSQEVINCGDAGQEGELIQRWVLLLAKNRLPVKRLWISSLTSQAIQEGFSHLKEGAAFDRLFYAGHTRAVGDWLLGINATRLYTVKYSQGRGVLSVGRVQTPTLALIVKRHQEITRFVPEDYWDLKTVYRDVTFSAVSGRFNSVDEANQALSKIKDSLFIITSFEKKKGNEAPPRLFDLTSLQVECNKKFGFTAEQTLNLVQQLYEKKQVTYPRVDTTYLPSDIYPKIPAILTSLTPYKEFTEPLLETKIKKSKKVFDDSKVTDHHAIIPTGEFNGSVMTSNEKKVFDIVARRFIAAFYPDCIVSNTTVLGEAAAIPFKATGKQILEDGWRILYKKQAKQDPEGTNNDGVDEQDKEEAEQIMPAFEKGESGPHEPGIQQKQTQPPKPYTEATLLRAMETAGKQVDDDELRDALKDNGIGRPSTRAAIIETLFKRNYIRRVRKNLEPTVTGIQLIETIGNELLKSVELTGQWEKKLREIERGVYEASEFIEEMKKMVFSLVQEVVTDYHRSSIEIENTPPKEAPSQSNKKKKETKKEGETPKEKNTKTSSPKTPPSLICPSCKKGNLIKGREAYGCSQWREGCTFKVPFTEIKDSNGEPSEAILARYLKKIDTN